MADIVTLTLNPALDLSTGTERVEPVRKLRCGHARRDPGGGGINVARVAGRLGGDVLAVYPAGGPIGRLLTQRLQAENLPSLTVEITGDTREDFTVLETGSGREFRFVLPGPRLTEAEWRACIAAAAGEPARFVVASGSLPEGAPRDIYGRLARQARRASARVALDTSGPALEAGLKAGVWLAKPNLRELQDLTGRALEDEAARLGAVRALISQGAAEVIALTLGEAGAMLITAERAWRAPALPIRQVSSVGAGDSFLGAMVWAVADGRELEEAFGYGLAAGSAALLSPGTELCRPQDVRRLLPQVRIEAV